MFITVALVTGFHGISANASLISPHAYAVYHNANKNHGGYFYNSSGQKDLFGAYAANGNNGFITDEMWCVFPNHNYWIEVGDMDGVLNGNYWAGHYAAKNDASGYTEYSIGSEFSGCGNSFRINLTDPNTWVVYVNGIAQLTFTEPYSEFDYTDIGIETNNTDSSFTNGISSTTLQMYSIYNDCWPNWTNNGVTNRDNNTLGWHSTYSASSIRINNKITFTR